MKAFFLLITLLTTPTYGLAQNIWFNDITEQVEISQHTAENILIEIKEYLFDRKELSNSGIYGDEKPRIVFLSLSNSADSATVVTGSGIGLKQAIYDALSQVDASTLSAENTLIRFDIVREITEVKASENTRMDLYDKSLYGIAFDKKTKYALLSDQLTGNSIFTLENKLDIGKLKVNLNLGSEQSAKTALLTLYRFSTTSYLYENDKIYPLYRGHKIFKDIEPEDLLVSAYNAGDYLINAINNDGSFVYSYNPSTNTISNKYNILRHAGTIYSLLQLYEIDRNPKILEGIERTINFMLDHIEECKPPAKENSLCLIHNNKIKLGANALAIITLTKYAELTSNDTYTNTINKLGQWILNTLGDNGQFTIHKQYYKSGNISSFKSEYYPGEATLALLSLYKLNSDVKWLNAASIAINHIIEQQQKHIPPHDHWLLYSLTEIYKINPEQKYLLHSKYIAEEIISTQNIKPKHQDLKGSYIKPESAPTATRTEGLIAAYELVKDIDDDTYKKKLLNSIQSGILFQMQLQVRKSNSLYYKEPSKAKHAFKRSFTKAELKIDYSQHNISSFLGYLKIIKYFQ